MAPHRPPHPAQARLVMAPAPDPKVEPDLRAGFLPETNSSPRSLPVATGLRACGPVPQTRQNEIKLTANQFRQPAKLLNTPSAHRLRFKFKNSANRGPIRVYLKSPLVVGRTILSPPVFWGLRSSCRRVKDNPPHLFRRPLGKKACDQQAQRSNPWRRSVAAHFQGFILR